MVVIRFLPVPSGRYSPFFDARQLAWWHGYGIAEEGRA